MPIFKYKAKHNQSGKIVRDLSVGLRESDVVNSLRRQNFSVISVSDVTNTLEAKINLSLNRVKAKDLVVFSRQFAVMVSANMPIMESLLILIEQTSNISLKLVISQIAFDVDSGSLLSDALAKHPKHFSFFFVNIIRSGETSGRLDEVLNYLADEMEKNHDMISKIRGAMIYPVFILAGLAAVAVVLMVYVLPSLTDMLSDSGVKLPLATRIIIATSNFMKKYIILIALAVIALAVLVRYYTKTRTGKYQIDYLKLKIPIFKNLYKHIYMVRFSRSLSTLLKGGVTINQSLEIVSDVIGNTIYRDIILATRDSINEGNPIATVMNTSPHFPKMVPHMINVGERSGKLESVLDRVSDFYNKEAEAMLANLSSLMEPIIMVIMGLGVGVMVAAVLLPMYNMANQF